MKRILFLLCVSASLRELCCSTAALAAAAGTTDGSFVVDGVKIHYVKAGAGTPVVLIHGWHSSIEMNWRPSGLIDELAKDHLVVALDLPGHGRSDKPDDDDAYGEQLVEDVVLLLDRLKIDKAHVVGYSLGGMVTLKLIAEHPERVLSGTLCGMGLLKAGSPLEKIWDRIPSREGGRTPAAFTRNVGRLSLSDDEVKGIKLPVEMIVGDRDPVKRIYVDPLHKIRPEWPVVEIAGAGHVTCIAKPQFREAVAAWIRKQSK